MLGTNNVVVPNALTFLFEAIRFLRAQNPLKNDLLVLYSLTDIKV